MRHAAAALFLLALWAPPSQPLVWQVAASEPYVYDAGGPLADGRVVFGYGAGLAALDPANGGSVRIGPGYPGAQGEPYFAISPGLAAGGCSFPRDDIYVLELSPPGGVFEADAAGAKRTLAVVGGVDSLTGIV